jgi:uncharacterized membrane protein
VGLKRTFYAAVALFIIVYVYIGIRQMLALKIGSNSGAYMQAALSFMHHLNTFDYSEHAMETSVHDQWLLIALIPFLAVWPHLETVIVVEVVVVAASAIVLRQLLRELGAGEPAATIFALAWLVSPSLQGFAFDDFTPMHFIPLLAFGMALAALRGRRVLTLVLAQALFGVKEDVILFVVWTGAIALWQRDRRLALAIAGLGALNLAGYAVYDRVHGYHSLAPAYGWPDPHPFAHLMFLLEILVPFAFAPLRLGRRMLIAVPFLAELFFAHGYAEGLLARAGSYYTIPLVTLCALGAAVVVARSPLTARYALGLSVLAALTLNPTVLRIGRHLTSPDVLYPVARAWGDVDEPVGIPCEDQGAWAVAATNPHADLTGCGRNEALSRQRAEYQNVPLGSTAPWTRGPAPAGALPSPG